MTDHEDWFEDTGEVRLSDDGKARHREMGAALSAAVVSRRRRRSAARWSASGLAAALLVTLAWPARLALPGFGPDRPAQTAQVELRHMNYGAVRDDASVLQRYGVTPAPLPAEIWVGDRQLVELLASAGRPTGLIRAPGRVVLTADVVDELGE